MKYNNTLVFNFIIATAILFSNILAFIPFYLLGVYAPCFYDFLSLLLISVTSLDSEIVKKFFIEIWSYLIQSDNIEEISFDIIQFFLSIMQLIFWTIYLVLDEFTLKDTSKDTPHNINNIDHEELKANIIFMIKKSDEDTTKDPALSISEKGKSRTSEIEQDKEEDEDE